MIRLNRDSCIRISLVHRDKWWFKEIVDDLFRKTKVYNEIDTYDRKKYFHIDRDRLELMIPRFYKLDSYQSFKIIDNVPDGEDINIKSSVVPRNEQQKEAMQWLQENNNGILCLGPGEGKTVICIDALCKIGKKTIIFIHKDKLVNQWIERFLQHSNITEDQIAHLSTAKHEECFKKPIVVSTVQTLCSMIKRIPDVYDKILKTNFGVAVWDECHTAIGAESFSLTSLHMPVKRVYGLSATPKRNDGTDDIMEAHVGEVFVPMNTESSTMDPRVIIIKFDHGIIKNHYNHVMHDTSYDRNKKIPVHFDVDRYYKMLTSCKRYYEVVRKFVNQISKSDRNMLFLANRIKILDECAKACVTPSDVGFFIPRSKKEQDAHLLRKMVFSTYGSARDGTDKPELDCIVLATPASNIEQAVGRGVRGMKGKEQPVVIDIVDIGSEDMIRRAEYRVKYYDSKNWKIEEKVLK